MALCLAWSICLCAANANAAGSQTSGPKLASTEVVTAVTGWSVVTVAGERGGFARFGDGSAQWLDEHCLESLTKVSVLISAVPASELANLRQVYGIASCARVANALRGSGRAGGAAWKIVTTSGKGDGFVLFGDQTRQWLDAQCITQLRAAKVTVKAVPWGTVKSMTQLPGVGECSQVLTNAKRTRR